MNYDPRNEDLSGSNSGGYSQEDIDKAVEDAIAKALEDTGYGSGLKDIRDALKGAEGAYGVERDAEGNIINVRGVQFGSLSGEDRPSLNPAIRQALSFGTGQTTDPRFSTYRNAQLQDFDVNANRRLGQTQRYFTRRGAGTGSAAEINTLNRAKSDISRERTSLSSNLGLQEFNAQNQAIGRAANLSGIEQGLQSNVIESKNRAIEGNLASIKAAIEGLSIPEQLRIAQTAAENAGTTSGGGGGGGGGLTVICTELNRQGLLTDELYQQERGFGEKMTKEDPAVMNGYHFLAAPVVSGMKKSKIFSKAVSFFVMPMIKEIAFWQGYGTGNFLGRAALCVGIPVCRIVGKRSKLVLA